MSMPDDSDPSRSWNPAVVTNYSALVTVRNTELQAHWARYNIHAVLNVGWAAAVFAARAGSFIYDHQQIAAGVGAILSLLWLGFVIESKWILTDRWDCHLRQFEGQYREQLPYTLFTLVNAVEGRSCLRALTFLQRLPPAILLVAWIGYWYYVRA